MALDLLEQRGSNAGHDGAYLLWSALAAVAESQRRAAQTDLARILLRGPWLCPAGCGARPRAAAELDELCDDHCIDCHRNISAVGRHRSLPDTAPPVAQSQVPHAAKYPVARAGRTLLRILDAGGGSLDTELSRICQRVS